MSRAFVARKRALSYTPSVFLFYLALFPVVAWVLPGYAVSVWLWPVARPLERAATSLLLGLCTVVPLAYVTVFLFRTPLAPGWILAAAVVVASTATALRYYRPLTRGPDDLGFGEPGGQGIWTVIGLVGIAVATTLTTEPASWESTVVWAPCPHQSAQLLLDDGSRGGLRAWDPQWERTIDHLSIRPHEPGYGLGGVLGNQRPGSMATIAQIVCFHGSAGLVVATFCYDLLVILLAGLLIARRVRWDWGVLLLAGAFLLGARAVSTYMVNENMLGLGLGLGALYLLLRIEHKADAAFAGICLGLCIGVRPIAAAYLAACVVFLWPPRSKTAWFAGALFCALLPWFLTNFQAFGDPLHHPSIGKGTYEQHFLGFNFRFHPLNFPVADQVLRPAFAPFPNLFQVPLEHARAFGVLFWAFVCCGAVATRGRELLGLALWAAPNYLMLLAIVSLDHEKLSYGLLSFAPLPLLAGAGLDAVLSDKLSLQRKVVACCAALAFTLGLPWLLRDATFPPDEREQHNNAIGEDTRSLAEQQAALTTPRWWPPWSPRGAVAWSLLTHAAPPQIPAGAVHTGPVLIWRNHFDLAHTLKVQLTDEPVLPAVLGNFQRQWMTVRTNMVVSLRVRALSRVVTVAFRHDGQRVSIHLDTGGRGDHDGYVNLGLVDYLLPRLQGVEVFLNGSRVPADIFIIEDSHQPEQQIPHFVTNTEWHFLIESERIQAAPGPDPVTRCTKRVFSGFTLGRARDVLLWSDGSRERRVRRVPAMPAPPPVGCRHVEMRRK